MSPRFRMAPVVGALMATLAGCGTPSNPSGESASSQNPTRSGDRSAAIALRRSDVCPDAPSQIVEIRGSDTLWRDRLVAAVACPNTLVQLGPDVDISFADYAGAFPIPVRKCVSLVSIDSFTTPVVPNEPPPPFTCSEAGGSGPVILRGAGPGSGRPQIPGAGESARRVPARRFDEIVGNVDDLTVAPESGPGPARSAVSRGPIIRHGKRSDAPRYFFKADCRTNPDDGVRFSGFQLEGPDQGPQKVDQSGIAFDSCAGVEVSNMEISGWGASAIAVNDTFDEGELKRTQSDGGRITSPDDVLIVGNFLHNNQHPSDGGHAAGYGVDLGDGAWARVSGNVFDQNRHSIAASGNVGGYLAQRNLVLRGGGYHGKLLNEYTHQFDVHGTDHCTAWYYGLGTLAALLLVAGAFVINPILGVVVGVLVLIAQIIYFAWDKTHIYNCGFGGIEINILDNAFQYTNGPDIKFRGTPRRIANVQRNVFPHSKLFESGISLTDAAVQGPSPLNINVATDNVPKTNTYGEYGYCDFDGDGVDDLFLATGASWWYSSYGEFHWSYMNAKTDRLKDLKFGYVDNDRRCDVLGDFGGEWHYVSGGYGNWSTLGAFGTPLKDAALGRFDASDTDFQSGATRQTTHALRRRSDGQWEVTRLLGGANWSTSYVVQGPNGPETKNLQNSGKPFDKLQFGDFNGDGVTDVLSVDGGRWSVSDSALGGWRQLNPLIGEEVTKLVIANMDADDNIDDVLKFQRNGNKATWYRSRNGTVAWGVFATYDFSGDESGNIRGFAGRFGAALGGATLVIDPDRRGHFHGITDATPDWESIFPY
jgi:hypothetical protein